MVFKVPALSSSQWGPELNPGAGCGVGSLSYSGSLSSMDVAEPSPSRAFQAWPWVGAWRENSWTKDQAPLWLLSPRHFSYSTVMGLRISWRSEHPQNPDPVGLGGARVCTGDKILMHVVPRTCCKGQDGPERRDPWAEVEGWSWVTW